MSTWEGLRSLGESYCFSFLGFWNSCTFFYFSIKLCWTSPQHRWTKTLEHRFRRAHCGRIRRRETVSASVIKALWLLLCPAPPRKEKLYSSSAPRDQPTVCACTAQENDSVEVCCPVPYISNHRYSHIFDFPLKRIAKAVCRNVNYARRIVDVTCVTLHHYMFY